MAAASETAPKERTYGNWRRPQTAGLGQLGLGSSIAFLLGLIAVVLAMLVSLMAAVVVGGLLIAAFIPLTIKDQYGRTLMARIGTRLAWRRSVKAGSHLYRGGPLGHTGHGTFTLPGLAASSTLSEARDAYSRPFALLTYPSTNTHVVVLACEADGAALVNQEQVDTWVAHWGLWLSKLAHEPGLIGASVTVEAAPDSGTRLTHEVQSNMADDAPPLARQMLEQVMHEYPAGSAQITTRIALTYSGAARAGHDRKSVDDVALMIGSRLPGLTNGLGMTGAGAARPMTATDLAEAVRVAYDPSVATLIEQARAAGGTGLTWQEAGPSGAQEAWDHYRHDHAYSVTWQMAEAPRGEVLSSVLTSLLQPSEDIARKRVTLLYRPHTSAEASRIVERDRRDASFRAQQSKVAKARDDVAVRAAEQSAREEATGAGVVRFALVATATVLDHGQLPQARAAIENLAPQARLRVREVTGSQAAAFASALPIGLVLPAHLRVPTVIRDNL
ncbi:SCO6880 family protein [Streptomyces alboflavus]|uniref:SCO6880 family protein n=1 Tax=Streptomyces alboflavus TaxID=67267 RepID=UPI000F6565F1|nr:SCO6880 family protein [Streptomyces alboflavus]